MSDLAAALDAYRKRCDSFTWNVPPDFNFARDVVDRFAADPDRPCTFYRDIHGIESRFTFGQMSGWIHRFAGVLDGLGVAKGERMLVLLPRVPEWEIATVGALAMGVVAVPTSMAVLSPEDIKHRINHSGAVALVAMPDAVAALDRLRPDIPSLKHFLVVLPPGETAPPGWIGFADAMAAATPTPGRATGTYEPALVFYTSGTTGKPKGVLHNHTYTYMGSSQASNWHDIRPDDRFWPTTGWAKAAFGPWSVGAEIVIVDGPFDPVEELDLLERLAPDVFCAPPTQYRLMAKHGLAGRRFPKLRECVAAGEPLNPEIIRVWQEATGIAIRDGYGQSESGLLVANLAGLPQKQGAMGLPVPGRRTAVIDEAGRELPAGEVGDIAARYPAPGLFMEYLHNPEATAKTRRPAAPAADSQDTWYLTGDRGWVDADGYFWFVGRADDVIISGSLRIGPFDVESLLVTHPQVVEAAAIAAPDADLGHVVKAVVVLKPGIAPSPEVLASLNGLFNGPGDDHKRPAQWEFVPALPKTATGKIRRAELRGS